MTENVVWQRTIADGNGNVLPGASIEVRDAVTATLVQLYSDIDGLSPIGNPVTADGNGFARFYVPTGLYDITATLGGNSVTWENERFGGYAPVFAITPEEIIAGAVVENPEYLPGNVLRYGTNTVPGTTDFTAAFQTAASVIAAGNGGIFKVPTGAYKVTAETDFGRTNNVTIEIDANASISCNTVAASNTDAIFNIGEVTEEQTTTLTAAVARGDTTISVASTSGFAIGDMCALVSDDEYWGGVSGTSGFGRKTKGELVHIQQVVDGTTLTLEIPADESYSISGYTVTLIKLPLIQNINIRCDGVFIGRGEGDLHTSSNPTGMRAFRIRCAADVEVSGGRFRDFPRVAGEFHLCAGVRVHDNMIYGRAINQSDNDTNISPWFTGMFFLGCNDVVFDGNVELFGRRHYDPDDFGAFPTTAGMVIGRWHTVSNNTAESCENVIGGHAVRHVTFSGNVGNDCGTGLRFRGRDVTAIGNDFGFCADAGIVIGGSTNDTYSETESPNVGHVTLLGNKGRTEGRGLHLRDDCDSFRDDDNLYVCSLAAGSPVGYGALIQGRRTRNLHIGKGTTFDLSGRVDNAVGIDFPNSSDTKRVCENIKVYPTIIGAYEGVHMSGVQYNVGDGKANGIDVDVTLVDCENIGIELRTGSFTNDGFAYFGKDCAFRQTIVGDEPTSLFTLSTAMHQFEQRPVMKASVYDRFVGYGDPATDLDDGETFAVGDRMTDPATGIEYRCTVAGTSGGDGGATATATAPATTITVASGSVLSAGQHITIAGAGPAAATLSTRIVSKLSSTSIVIANATSTTVSGATINFVNPTFESVTTA